MNIRPYQTLQPSTRCDGDFNNISTDGQIVSSAFSHDCAMWMKYVEINFILFSMSILYSWWHANFFAIFFLIFVWIDGIFHDLQTWRTEFRSKWNIKPKIHAFLDLKMSQWIINWHFKTLFYGLALIVLMYLFDSCLIITFYISNLHILMQILIYLIIL